MSEQQKSENSPVSNVPETPIEPSSQPTPQPQEKAIPRRAGLVILIVVLMFGTGTISSFATAYFMNSIGEKGSTYTVSPASSTTSNGASVFENVSKSVVSITTKSVQQYGRTGWQYLAESAGTGVIISGDGYILTNNHVIQGARQVTILTSDEKEFSAEVVKTEPDADLALIKVTDESAEFQYAQIGNSEKIAVGEDVYAIGNALGRYQNSVTKGIVSGLGRPITTGDSGLRGNLQEFEDLIQTDAAINSGNSGGPLINSKGEVIGINTAVDGEAQNIGFAIPINRAQTLIEQAK